ncbi:MAG: nickel pincer cofactor biosynthesis protein LarC [Mycobacteriales bacterium]
MFLGALVDAGVSLAVLQRAVNGLPIEPVTLRATPVLRGGIGATQVTVAAAAATAPRSWADIEGLLRDADLLPPVRAVALAAFGRLAQAEAAVHRVPVAEVHFHEVGGLDALADIVGAAAGVHALGLTSLTASTVALGSGASHGLHGPVPVPGPAVLELLRGIPVTAGAGRHEMTTPTGAALLSTVVTDWGGLPPMQVTAIGMGAGSRDPLEHANVLRLVLGSATAGGLEVTSALLLETNVDDLDPRLWPGVLQRLLDLGADDAWLTPILMKKGRPAHLLTVLCAPEIEDAARQLVVRETSTIGMRITPTNKHALARRELTVLVENQPVRVKVAYLGDTVVNANPEYEDVVVVAAALGRPLKSVLAAAASAAQQAAGLGPAPTGADQTVTKNASTPDRSVSGTATTS